MLRIRPNGERRRVVSTGTCVRDENGDVALAIVVFRDVTELRRLEQQREEYLSLVSHDLRNPLSVLTMSFSTLRSSIADKGGRRLSRAERLTVLERAERNTKRMNTMLDELREATSLESQAGALEKVPCDMRAVIADVVDSLDDVRMHRVSIETDDGASTHVVLGDASRLERVVANLVTNALKYSAEEAPVTVRLDRKDGNVVLEVADRGIGIAPASVKRLFDRYYRTPAGKTRASGLGLGLYIARLIAELHGGRIELSSEIDKGSTFRLVLPAHVGPPA
jgi:two-component system, OmpR family, phosphate regulon sensor histidine kinase PhoR